MTATAHGWTAESNNQLTWRGPTGSRSFRAVADLADLALAACIRDAALLAEARRLTAEHHDATPEGKAEIEVALLALLTEEDTDG